MEDRVAGDPYLFVCSMQYEDEKRVCVKKGMRCKCTRKKY